MTYKMKKGGSSKDWISKAVNPKHKGYCTPMTKETCTPKRKALAKTFKSMAKEKKKQEGGTIDFLTPLLESFKKGGSLDKTVSYQDGIENNTKIPKYANAKCGKKLVKKTPKKQTGGYIQKSVEQDKRNQDYLNNPFNLERI